MNKKIVIIPLIIISLLVPVNVKASESTGRLRACLEDNPLYLSTTISSLNSSFSADRLSFKQNYDGKHVVFSGTVGAAASLINRKYRYVYDESGNSCAVNTLNRDAQVVFDTLNSGDSVTVYGRIDVTGLFADAFEIVAEKAVSGAGGKITSGSYVYYGDKEISGVNISDLTSDKRSEYCIPKEWKDAGIISKLTNNGVKGYQYSLNALAPQNYEYPEIFYVFYFENETYLERPPKDAFWWENEDIEESIIRNILGQFGNEQFKVHINDIEDANGTEYDYFLTSYRPKDGNDYKLEFVFRPDQRGITCMLYLYFPKEGAVNHVKEVTYALETMNIVGE